MKKRDLKDKSLWFFVLNDLDLIKKKILNLAGNALQDATAFATAAQGDLADSATQPGDLGNIATITVPTIDPGVANTVWYDGTNLVVSAGV